jgi:hypothetical protein
MTLIGALRPLITYFYPSFPFRTTEQSAADLIYVCFDQKELGVHPKAVNVNGRVKEDTSAESKDEAKQRLLWEASIKLLQMKGEDTALANWT